ncbi:MAG: hypothetical protein IT222_05100, partial [Crocinitomix sp.]|nr:hypothetical protein [Crocinitomix sp.]
IIPEDADLNDVMMNIPAGIGAMSDMISLYSPRKKPDLKYATELMKKGFRTGVLLYPFVGYVAQSVNEKVEEIRAQPDLFEEFGDLLLGLGGGKGSKSKLGSNSSRKKAAKAKIDKVKKKKPEKPASVIEKEAKAKKPDEDPSKKKPEEDTPDQKEKKSQDDLWLRLTKQLDSDFSSSSMNEAVTPEKINTTVARTLADRTYVRVRGKHDIDDYKPSPFTIQFTLKRKGKVSGKYKKEMKNMLHFARNQPRINHYFDPLELNTLIRANGGDPAKITSRWKTDRQLKELISDKGPRNPTNTFYHKGGVRDINKIEKPKREIFGFKDNVKKESAAGLTVMKKGFTDLAWKETQETPDFQKAESENGRVISKSELLGEKSLLQKLARFQNARWKNGNIGKEKLKKPFFNWDEAIMGHDDSQHMGASGYWNDIGNTFTRNDNMKWNKNPDNYWGPEYKLDSSASGSAAPEYDDPTKNSNPSWWNAADSNWLGHTMPDYKFELTAT